MLNSKNLILDNDKVKEYVHDILYNKYWYAVLPIKTAGLLVYFYYYSQQGYTFLEIKNVIQDKGINYKLLSLPESEHKIETLKKNMLEKHGHIYAQSLSSNIQLLEKLDIMRISKNTIIFKRANKNIFDYFSYIPYELICELKSFKDFKLFKHVLYDIVTNLNDSGVYYLDCNEFKKRYSIDSNRLKDIIYFLNTYLLDPIEKDDFCKLYTLKFDVNSNEFNEFIISLKLMKGGNNYNNRK